MTTLNSRFVRLLVAAFCILFNVSGHSWASESKSCGPVPPGGVMDSQCHVSAAPLPLSTFKGLELYSWQERGKWYFSLVSGKNSEQSATEISGAKVEGVTQLKERLKVVASGTEIFWNTRPVAGLKLRKPGSPEGKVLRRTMREFNIALVE